MAKTKKTLISVKKSNNLIQSIGKTTLLSNKVFLTSLLKIENRSGVPAKEVEYYRTLEKASGTDFTHGLVAEFSNSDMRRLMDSKSGSYYKQVEELMDAQSSKSLRNQWVIMIKDKESGLYGSTDVITSTLYDDKAGKLYIKFSSEKKIQDELYNLKTNYTLLDYALMMSFKSVYTYKLYEIVMSRIGYEDGISEEQKDSYSYTYGIAELKYMLGILDPYINKEVRVALTGQYPDFEKIEEMLSGEKTMPRYTDFQRYTLKKAKEEIDKMTDWIFDYQPLRNGRGGKVVAVELRMTRKKKDDKKKVLTEDEKIDFVDTIQDIIPYNIKVKELKSIAETAGYDLEKVKKAVSVLQKTKEVDNVVGFLLKAIKEDYEVPIQKNTFNTMIHSDYDFDALEKALLSQGTKINDAKEDDKEN
ncbi:MAG: replication initiation protein [Lachnospiraceae bacterium]|nr:replication initiation protein [Lachnospiraceae bacterium]